jgi:hypothetical protein
MRSGRVNGKGKLWGKSQDTLLWEGILSIILLEVPQGSPNRPSDKVSVPIGTFLTVISPQGLNNGGPPHTLFTRMSDRVNSLLCSQQFTFVLPES